MWAEAESLQVICLDAAFKGYDQLKANAVQTFKARAQAEESEIVFRTIWGIGPWRFCRWSNREGDMMEIVIYEGEGGTVEVRVERETVWLTQRQMAELFDTSTKNVGLHLKNIHADKELGETETTEEYSVVRQEVSRQVRCNLKHYNLDAIISVGYRVTSRRGMRFRQWATWVLKEHLIRGYTLDRQRFEENERELEAALTDCLEDRDKNEAEIHPFP